MAAKMERTDVPGVFKRGSKFVATYYVDGKLKKESAATKAEAKKLKRQREVERDQGVYAERSSETFESYAREWVERYRGKGKGFRERTRDEYRRDLQRFAYPFLGKKRLDAIRRRDIDQWIAWLCDDNAQARRHEQENLERAAQGMKPLRTPGPLRDATVKRILAVLSACLSSAEREELRRDNPVRRAVPPSRDPVALPGDENDEGPVKALTREQLAAFLLVVHPDWRLFFRFLAATGLRVSEAIALDVAHLELNGSRPHVKVQRAYSQSSGRAGHFAHPKSRHGRRTIPLPSSLVADLRSHIAALPEPSEKWGRLLFSSTTGTPISAQNLHSRVMKPALEEAGAGWAAFHAFRHFYASAHIDRGTNVVQLSRLLGHHKPSMTLDTYSHLLDKGVGAALDVDAEIAQQHGRVEVHSSVMRRTYSCGL